MNLRTRPPAEKCSEKSTKLSVLNSPVMRDDNPVIGELILLDWNMNRATFEFKVITGEISVRSGPITLFVDDGCQIVNCQITD